MCEYRSYFLWDSSLLLRLQQCFVTWIEQDPGGLCLGFAYARPVCNTEMHLNPSALPFFFFSGIVSGASLHVFSFLCVGILLILFILTLVTSLIVCISLLITFLDPKSRSCDVERERVPSTFSVLTGRIVSLLRGHGDLCLSLTFLVGCP